MSFAWCVPTAAPNIAKPVLNHLLSFTWSSFHSSLHCPTSRFPGPRSWWLLQLSSLPFIRVSSAASLLATNNPHLGRISGLLHQQPPFTQDVIASLWRLPILLNTPRYGQSVLHHIHSRTSFGVYLSFEHLFFHPTQITLSFASASVSVVSSFHFLRRSHGVWAASSQSLLSSSIQLLAAVVIRFLHPQQPQKENPNIHFLPITLVVHPLSSSELSLRLSSFSMHYTCCYWGAGAFSRPTHKVVRLVWW